MKSRTGIIIGLIVIIIVAASAAVYMQQKSSNATLTPSIQQAQIIQPLNQIDVTVKTDGTTTTVHAVSIPEGSALPHKMVAEMQSKAIADVNSDKSTVETLKNDMNVIAQKYNYSAKITISSQFGIDQLPFAAVVNGDSMIPTLKDGHLVVALKTSDFKVGDIVIARHPSLGLIIKRVASIKNGKVFLKSDNRKIEVINNETTLPDGTVEINTYKKVPLDTWQLKKNVIGVVKTY
ncbi:MAG: S24/S26 family peptidase [Methanobacterium sp.]|uniref:S24/S26 family peptidase n=1 Tax=Methanobacterium sp. TaxID=2164 RepID=UPI003D648D56|nr:S24/S26 family peptidase [Methanobacterium sp.]